MSAPLHLIVGPARHGVTRHAQAIADACGHPWRRIEQLESADLRKPAIGTARVVHIAFTDRLFGSTCEVSAQRLLQLADTIRAQGAHLSVTLHDVPHGHDPLQQRRRRAYREVAAVSHGLVVSSWHELTDLEEMGVEPHHSLQVIPLPVDRAAGPRPRPTGSDAVVLGFVYPDRGYETVLEALPPGSSLVAMGQASDGHGDLLDTLAARAKELDRQWTCTGFIADGAIPHALRTAAVPIAPNPRPSASASIADWLRHGRRPLVADSPLTRELDRRWPGTLTRYDTADIPRLRELIAERLAHPGLTILDPAAELGPPLSEVAERYARHLFACTPKSAIDIDGRALLPGNRWDLAGGPPSLDDRPSISVIIPYFDDQRRLDLVLAAIAAQTYPPARLEIVIADDGSPECPDVSCTGALAVRVVRQPDQGFRAAAARNLGARAASGDILAFLDADTIPEPTYLERLTRLQSAAHDVVTVGRRRHADLTGWSPQQVRQWMEGSGPPPTQLVEPRWLIESYQRSSDLLEVDERSYRHVISAVLAIDRDLFTAVDGFDERFVGYGGEDWELANRLFNAGAVLAHVRDAVAWHDGPDWAGRPIADRTQAKNAETALLARLLPDPAARGAGSWAPYPRITVTLPATDIASVLATVRSGLATGLDCGFWLLGDRGPAIADQLGDPRVHPGHPAPDVAARASIRVELDAPGDLRGLATLCDQARGIGAVDTPAGRILTTRAARRAERWGASLTMAPAQLLPLLFGISASTAVSRWPEELDLAVTLASL